MNAKPHVKVFTKLSKWGKRNTVTTEMNIHYIKPKKSKKQNDDGICIINIQNNTYIGY